MTHSELTAHDALIPPLADIISGYASPSFGIPLSESREYRQLLCREQAICHEHISSSTFRHFGDDTDEERSGSEQSSSEEDENEEDDDNMSEEQSGFDKDDNDEDGADDNDNGSSHSE